MIISAIRKIRSSRRMKKYCHIGGNVSFGDHAWCSGEVGAVSIGHDSYIDCSLLTQGTGSISIGPYSWIGGGSSTAIGSFVEVSIGSHAIISNHVHIYDNNNHPTDPSARRQICEGGFFNDGWTWKHSECAPVSIGDNVWIGEFSMILKGVSIGEGSVVAAHSVVTKDVPSYCVVAGNPAKVVKRLKDHGEDE